MNHEIADFVAEARRYCALIEAEDATAHRAFEKECLVALLRLYEQILRLPNAYRPHPPKPGRILHEEWQAVRERTAQRTERDEYWVVFEPFAENKPDPVCASISDDLADIWRDVKEGLSIFDSGKPNYITDAVWHWRFSFGSHWGYHVAGAIRALTALQQQSIVDE